MYSQSAPRAPLISRPLSVRFRPGCYFFPSSHLHIGMYVSHYKKLPPLCQAPSYDNLSRPAAVSRLFSAHFPPGCPIAIFRPAFYTWLQTVFCRNRYSEKRRRKLNTKANTQRLDMLHGPIWYKVPQFALPVAATAILQQLAQVFAE